MNDLANLFRVLAINAIRAASRHLEIIIDPTLEGYLEHVLATIPSGNTFMQLLLRIDQYRTSLGTVPYSPTGIQNSEAYFKLRNNIEHLLNIDYLTLFSGCDISPDKQTEMINTTFAPLLRNPNIAIDQRAVEAKSRLNCKELLDRVNGFVIDGITHLSEIIHDLQKLTPENIHQIERTYREKLEEQSIQPRFHR